jgi:uncharacterized repeat protein (TIGR03803 family)
VINNPTILLVNNRSVFHPRLFIVLMLWASLGACQSPPWATARSSTEPTSTSTIAAATLTTIVSFDGSNGSRPLGMVRAGDGNFYGVAESSRAGAGAIFRLTPDGELKAITQFSGETNGYSPRAEPILGRDGHLYGTTVGGGANGNGFGTVFRVTTEGKLTTLAVFDRRNGASPERPLIQAQDGNFYGTTYMGGAHQQGTVFRLTQEGKLTTLVHFKVGQFPGALDLIQDRKGNFYVTHGNFYGTQYMADGAATIFRLIEGQKLIPFASFVGLNKTVSRDAYPNRLVEAQDGNFYGVTLFGNFFRLTPDGQRTTIATFQSKFLFNHLIQGQDGNFYGTANGLEPPDPGMVFRITPQGELIPLAYFSGRNESSSNGGGNQVEPGKVAPSAHATDQNGSFPSSLIEAERGTFYGTTEAGGKHNQGTIFKLTVR